MKILASLNPLNKERSVIYLIALLIGAMSTPTANAGGYYRNGCYYSYPIVEKRVEIVKKVVPVYQLEFVKIPVNALSYYPVTINSSYNVSVASENYVNVPQPYAVPVAAAPIAYQPVYQPAVAVKKELSCDEKIELALSKSEKRLVALLEQRLTGNFQPTGNGSGTTRMSASVIVQKCATCHDAKDNAAKGKGYVFFEDGIPTRWDAATRFSMLQQIKDGLMPKNGKLTEDEQANIVDFILSGDSKANGGRVNSEPSPEDPTDNPPRDNGNGGRQ